MRIALDNLPTDTTMLRHLVRDMAAVIDANQVEAAARQQVITESQTEIDRLWLIIRQFQRERFGRSAERLDPDQMAFGLEDLEGDLAHAEAKQGNAISAIPAEPSMTQSPKPHRSPLPAHLPRVETIILPPHVDCCPDCGGALHDAGSTSSEMLDWIPAQIRVVRITRSKCACRACGTLHQAPASERVLAGGLATPGLIAHVLVSRYCDHLPLYRKRPRVTPWMSSMGSRDCLVARAPVVPVQAFFTRRRNWATS